VSAILINPLVTVPLVLLIGFLMGLVLPSLMTGGLTVASIGVALWGLNWLNSLHNDAGWGVLLPVDVLANGSAAAVALLLGSLFRYIGRRGNKGESGA
jgi:hypothetical protein